MTDATKAAVIRWNRFFYSEFSAASYSLFGLVFYSYVLIFMVLSPLNKPWRVAPLFESNLPLFQLFHVPRGSYETVLAVTHWWWVTLGLCAIGLLGKPMRLVAFVLALYVCGQKQNGGFVFHEESTLILSLLVITVAPKFPLSVWGWIRTRGKCWGEAIGETGRQYLWPIQLLRLILVYVIFSSALLKLYFGGFYWFQSNVLFDIATSPTQHKRPGFAVDWLAAHESICRVLTLASIVLELMFPLALCYRSLRAPLVLGALSMLLGVWVVAGIHFVFFMGPLFLAFLPWEKIPVPNAR